MNSQYLEHLLCEECGEQENFHDYCTVAWDPHKHDWDMSAVEQYGEFRCGDCGSEMVESEMIQHPFMVTDKDVGFSRYHGFSVGIVKTHQRDFRASTGWFLCLV